MQSDARCWTCSSRVSVAIDGQEVFLFVFYRIKALCWAALLRATNLELLFNTRQSKLSVSRVKFVCSEPEYKERRLRKAPRGGQAVCHPHPVRIMPGSLLSVQSSTALCFVDGVFHSDFINVTAL